MSQNLKASDAFKQNTFGGVIHPVKTAPNFRVLFGNASQPVANATLATSLPEWATKMPLPSATIPDMKKVAEQFTKALEAASESREEDLDDKATKKAEGKKEKNFLFTLIGQITDSRKVSKKIEKELTQVALEYLPKESQELLKKYKRSPMYWVKRVFNPSEVKLMTVVYQGPLAIKRKQIEIDYKNANSRPFLEKGLEVCEKAWKTPEVITDVLPDKIDKLFKYTRYLTLPLAKIYFKHAIKNLDIYMPLFEDVPALDYKFFEKDLDKIKTDYNSNPTTKSDPITSISKKGIGSGSVAQVFFATTQSGQNLVIKVLRPDANPKYFDQYHQFLYYINLIKNGTSAEAKLEAVRQAQATVQVLNIESNAENEARNTNAVRNWLKEKNITSFDTPEIKFVSENKRGLVMTFVGDAGLASLIKKKEYGKVGQTKLAMVEDLTDYMLLCPEKHLDIHSGNVRSGKTPFLIDYGREASLDKGVHDNLLKLMTLVYSADSRYDFLDQPGILDTLSSLVKQGDKDNNIPKAIEILQNTGGRRAAAQKKLDLEWNYQEALNTTPNLPEPDELKRAKQDTIDAENAETTLHNFIASIFEYQEPKLKKEFNNSGLAALAQAAEELTKRAKIDKKLFSNAEPALMSVWTNYAQMSFKPDSKVVSISAQPISQDDMDTCRDKYVSFTKEYFWTPKSEKQIPDIIENVIKKMKAEDLYKAFDYPSSYIGNTQFFYLSKHIGTELFNLASKHHFETEQNEKDKIEAKFQTSLAKVIKRPEAMKAIAIAYIVNTRCRQMADQLSKSLTQYTTVTLDAKAQERLRNNIEISLRNDFGLTSSSTDIATYLKTISLNQ